jgi:hypothetical protein
MPQICDMGQTALLPLRRKACCGFFLRKNPTVSAGFVPVILGTRGQHANHCTTEAAVKARSATITPKILDLTVHSFVARVTRSRDSYALSVKCLFFWLICKKRTNTVVVDFELISQNLSGRIEKLGEECLSCRSAQAEICT